MNLKSVIEDLVYDKGLDRDRVEEIVCQGIESALSAKEPGLLFKVSIEDENNGSIVSFIQKTVVSDVNNDDIEISVEKAKRLGLKTNLGEIVLLPYDKGLTRVDIIKARNYISGAIKRLEQDHIYQIFKDKVGDLVSGTVYRAEAFGFVVNLGETLAFLPASCSGNTGEIKPGAIVKSIIRDVLPFSEKGSQVVLDRTGADYVEKIFELEIPEIFEGHITIVKAVRIAGYKTKMILKSNTKNIDPVGSCVGLAGSRIKPILNELNGERVDLIPWDDDKVTLIKKSLLSKNADKDIRRVIISPDGLSAEVWVDNEAKSTIIGKNGGNINLASKLLDINIRILQE